MAKVELQVAETLFEKSKLNFDCEDWGKLDEEEKEEEKILDDNYCDDFVEGCSNCDGCDKVSFLLNGRCKSCIQQKILRCISCQCQRPETEFPFIVSEEQVEEGEDRLRSNICDDCQAYKNNEDDRDDYYCYQCDRPSERCLCDCWEAHCDEQELESQYDDICDDCGSRYCHCYCC